MKTARLTCKATWCTLMFLQVTQDMGIEPPVSISSKLGDFNNLFRKIITAAQHPHLSIPETEAGKSRKHYNRLINRSLMAVSSTFPLPEYWILTQVFSETNKKLQTHVCVIFIFNLYNSWSCCCGRGVGCIPCVCHKKERFCLRR